jgi:fructosamine-3-kinase
MISSAIVGEIETETGFRVLPSSGKSVSGGCIHQSAIFETEGGGSLFVKQNNSEALKLFETEFRSLEWLASTETVRVPRPFHFGEMEGTSYLVLEAISLSNRSDSDSSRKMGQALALLHSAADDRFGADYDNFIGATPQPNPWTESWADFFTKYRLEHMFQLAAKRGKHFQNEARLLGTVHSHLSSLDISPSLLHGDFWGGNASFDMNGDPVLFDPASYMGDREADIAFTRVFGGFGPGFYEAYRETFPEPEPIRETIYNLYHILNHFVLFGGGYGDQADTMIREIMGSR